MGYGDSFAEAPTTGQNPIAQMLQQALMQSLVGGGSSPAVNGGGAPTGGVAPQKTGGGGGVGGFFADPGNAGMLGQLGQAFAPNNAFVQKLGESTIALAKAQSAKKLADEETKKQTMAQDMLLKQAQQGQSPYDANAATSMQQPKGPPQSLGSAFAADAGMGAQGGGQPSTPNFR